MLETWRWFGPEDPVSLKHIIQAGAKGVVTALHEIPTGEPWPLDAVLERKKLIEDAGLLWSVVESIPVHLAIKLRSGDYRRYIENYKVSLESVGKAGVQTVCYNFMPVIDWTRTNLAKELPNSAVALSFEMVEVAIYDLYVLQRENAHLDYSEALIERAGQRFRQMSEAAIVTLETNILAGLPGGEGSHDREGFRQAVNACVKAGDEGIRKNFHAFLQEVLPVAEKAGVRMSIHPDDPPFPLFGIPRVMSTANDAREMLRAAPSSSNGITLCAGSFGARSDNDLVRMAKEFGPKINFVHLRNVRREDDGSFHESDHLNGDNDMIGLIAALMDEEDRRSSSGGAPFQIPMRPDHGHLIGDEANDDKTRPGYSFAGRMKGLAELRGVMMTLKHLRTQGAV
jgi:mannonate dehydratase